MHAADAIEVLLQDKSYADFFFSLELFLWPQLLQHLFSQLLPVKVQAFLL